MRDVEPLPDGATAAQPARALTPAQLMERLQISENTVYQELQNGSLKDIAFRVGRQWRVSETALERLMSRSKADMDGAS